MAKKETLVVCEKGDICTYTGTSSYPNTSKANHTCEHYKPHYMYKEMCQSIACVRLNNDTARCIPYKESDEQKS